MKIIAHSGYKGDERPAAVTYRGRRYDVVEIEESWITQGEDPKVEEMRWFVVRCNGGARFRLHFGQESGWEGEILPGPRLV